LKYVADPQGRNCGEDKYKDEFCSRDFERTPMQWDETQYAGAGLFFPLPEL